MKEKDIKKIVAIGLGINENDFTIWSSFKDLKADKLDRWEIVVMMESTLKKKVSDSDFKKLRSTETKVYDLMRYANSHI